MRITIEQLKQLQQQPNENLFVECSENKKQIVFDILKQKNFDLSKIKILISFDTNDKFFICRKTWKYKDNLNEKQKEVKNDNEQ